MKVEIWSDYVCPFCYIGKRKFELALERFAHKEQIETVFRSFELDPAADPNSNVSTLSHACSEIRNELGESERNNGKCGGASGCRWINL